MGDFTEERRFFVPLACGHQFPTVIDPSSKIGAAADAALDQSELTPLGG